MYESWRGRLYPEPEPKRRWLEGLGPVLWQLPENFHRDDERLGEWLAALERAPSSLHTIEFRHPSWFAAPVLEALRARHVALTIGDHPSRPFQSLEATAGWRFVRFHRGARGRRGNDWEGFAPANARLLTRLVDQATGAASTGTPKRS